MFASAAVIQSEDFEGSSLWTGVTAAEYGEETPVALQYPFTATNAKYGVLDDDASSPAAEGATCFDMYVQFTAMTEEPTVDSNAKLAVYVDSKGDIHVISGGTDYTTGESVDSGDWVRLTIVEAEGGYKVYARGTPLDADDIDDNIFPAATGATTVEFTGTGKLDNFVARTTDPFGDAPTGWIAKVGDDPEQYYTDYTAVLTAALNGASLTYSAGNEMDGSAAHPFLIKTAADLQALATAVASVPAARTNSYVQTADIDMSEAGAFAGIGVYNANPTAGTPFSGTYDGGNFKICNVDFTQRNYGGVFNQVNGGTIKNLTVSNITCSAFSSSVNDGEWGGAIVGNAGNGATLQNLVAEGTFAADHPATHNVAGIVIRACGGGENGTLIKDCTNNATLYGAYTKIGGICAITQYKIAGGAVTFDGCANNGDIISSRTTATGVTGYAGILGYVDDNTVLVNCSNTGSIVNNSGANTDKDGQLIGWVYSHTLTLEDAGTIAATDLAKIGDVKTTVVLDWAISGDSGKNFDFNVYGKTGSTVELRQDFTGYPAIGSSIAPALKLSANMTINNGNKNSTNATFAVVTGTGNLTMSNAQATRWYVITKLQNYSGVISAGSYEKVAFGDIVTEAGYGTALVKAGSNFNVDALASTKVNGASASLVVDTVDNQKGIYLVAAQVVADDESTTDYASVENALAAADAAYASTVNVLDPEAAEVEKAGWSYEDGVYTSTRAIATLKGSSYPSLTKALAAAQDGDTVTLVAATSEAVTIPAGVTVAVTDDVAFSGKLSGAGAIKYTKVPQKFPASTLVAGEWTGTFIIAYNQETSANIAFNSYGISGSYVEIAEGCSLTGHCMGGTLATLVVNGTLNIVDGSSSTTATIYALAGSGNVSVTQNRKYTFSNLVDWNGTLTSNGNLISIGNVTSGAGSIEYQTTPAVAPTVGEDFEGEVYLNFNYSNYDVYKYAGANATVKLGTMTGHLHDGAGETGQTGEIPGKTVVAGAVVIDNGWTISSANWTAAKVVKFDSLKVDGSLTLDSTATGFGSARCYYYAKSLDAAGAGTITVGDGFGLRIDAVDFAEAPSGSDVLVRLTLAEADLLTTDGQLFGTGGTLNGSIAVTVNGEATEQTLVYDADKGGLVLYVAPTPVAIDPSDVVINYNCYATLSVTGYPEGATFGWTMYTNNVACKSTQGPVKISSGKTTATVKVYSETTAIDGVVARVAITNGEDVIEREATITVADVAAKIGETEYTKAQLDNAIADAISSGDVLEHYLGVSTTISKGQTLKTKKLAERNGTASVKAAASTTAGEAWTIAKTEEDGVITWSVGTETAYFEFTSADSQTVEYLASPKNAAGVNKLLSDATITKQFSVTKDGVVLDLNGHALTSTFSNTSSGAFYVNVISPAPAALTVKDSVGGGSIAAASAHSVFMLGYNGQLTVEGGSFTGKHIVYGSKTTSAATITGGTFTATDAGFTLNMLDSARGTITVTGGTFTGFNPANNSAEGAGTNFVPNGYVSTETSTGVWTVSKSAGGFPGGEDGKTFTIDTAVQDALAEKIPAGKALTDAVAGTTSGVTYAQAYALGLLDEETGDVEKDVTPTIEIVNGKVVVSLDATAKDGYKVMLNVYEKASLTAEWPVEPTTSYEFGSETEAAGFTPSAAGAGFYKVGVTIEDAE